jgi:sulfoxide reductase heme-binding subunit YedZ
MSAIASTGAPALWYLTRGTGVVALLLLSASVVLGVVHAGRRRAPGGGRLLVESVHRTVSLLVVALLAVHVLTSVLDSFAPIRLADAVVPFVSAYRALWVGFGALAFDLLLAVALTSVLRRRLGYRGWRAVHWLAYLCWPIAVAHGLGSGSDARAPWMLAIALGCVAAVVIAAATRLSDSGPGHRMMRSSAAALLAAGLIGLAVWLPQGPLAQGWAQRAGTPSRLLAAARPQSARATAVADARGFSATLSGAERDGTSADGSAVVDLALRLEPGPGTLRVRLAGPALAGGGVALRTSAVTLVHGAVYQGRIEQLDGTTLGSLVATPDGRALQLRIELAQQDGALSGQLIARPAGGELDD